MRRELGGSSALEALKGPALAALPTVARWQEELQALGRDEQASLIERADQVLSHRFDLLGSGPIDLGTEIDWQMDFKSGRRWPLEHITRVPIVYGDGSDIKVPWELSRSQHLPLLAAAHRVTGDDRYLEEIGAQVEGWIDGNPVEFGANWACTMDAAIRAANWVATFCLCAEAAADLPWLSRGLESLFLHGRFVRSHLEWAEIRGNHYLSDIVGLLTVAALFSSGREGRRWTRWSVAELVREMEHQVRADGCDHEMSLPYHRLVTELFVCGTQAADALMPGRIPPWYRKRLSSMLAFVSDHTRPDGLAPQIGDADSGRFLPLGDYGHADPRSHLHLFRQGAIERPPPQEHVAYPDGGYWIVRDHELFVIVRCGDVGLGGRGGHAHNDQLSIELALGAQPLIVDPGTYLYTAAPEARNLFRSTAFHATLRIDGEEQNPITDALFVLEDRTHSQLLRSQSALFSGRHFGYAALDPPATHERTVRVDGSAARVSVLDAVESSGPHELEWTFPLAPDAVAHVRGDGITAVWPATQLRIEAQGVSFAVEEGWNSPEYGVRVPTPFVRARRRSRPGRDETSFDLSATRT